jgi:hypothetical protein
MSEKTPSKDEALEALDFIVNVLKEHEKDLDRLVSELGTVASQMGETGEFSGKVKKIEDKVNGLQGEVTSLIKSLSTKKHEPMQAASEETPRKEAPAAEAPKPSIPNGFPLLLQCKQWEDFESLAAGAQRVSFSLKESGMFEVDALKGNQMITFSGELPKISMLTKLYLARKLQVPDGQVFEGEMALE